MIRRPRYDAARGGVFWFTLLAVLLTMCPAALCSPEGVPFLHRGRLYSIRNGMVGPGFWEVGFEAVLGEDGVVAYLDNPQKDSPYFSDKPFSTTVVVRRYDSRTDTLGTERRILPTGDHRFEQIALQGNILYVAGTVESEQFLGWLDISADHPIIAELDHVSPLKNKPLDDLVVDNAVLYGIDDIVEPKWMVVYDLETSHKPALRGLVELRAGLNEQIVKAHAGSEYLAMLCHSVHMGGSSLGVELYDKRTFAHVGDLRIKSSRPAGSEWSWGEISNTFNTRDRDIVFVDGSVYVAGSGGQALGAKIPDAWRVRTGGNNVPVLEEIRDREGNVIPIYRIPEQGGRTRHEPLVFQPVMVETKVGTTSVADLAYVPTLAKYIVWTEPGARPFLAAPSEVSLGKGSNGGAEDKRSNPLTNDVVPVLLSPKAGAVVTSLDVMFSWEAVPQAESYDVTATGEGRVVLDVNTKLTNCTAPFGFGKYGNVGKKLRWTVRAKYVDGRVGDWQVPAEMVFQLEKAGEARNDGLRSNAGAIENLARRGPPVPSDTVKITISLDPEKPVADGQTMIRVKATVKDQTDRPVRDAIVGFELEGYYGHADHRVIRPGDKIEGGRYLVESGRFVNSSNPRYKPCVTDEKGEAEVLFVVPEWGEHMAELPVVLKAEYHANYPRAERQVFFQKP